MLLAFLFVCGPYSIHLTHTCILYYIYTLDVYYCLLTSLANEMYTMALWQNKVSIFYLVFTLGTYGFQCLALCHLTPRCQKCQLSFLFSDYYSLILNVTQIFIFFRDLFLFYVNVCLCLCEQMLYVCKCLQRPGHWVS